MRAKFLWLAAVAWLALVGVHAQGNTFAFFASVADLNGTPVTDLTIDDFEILENGAAGKILKLEPIDWPVKIQLLVDNSVDMAQELVAIRNGTRGFLKALPDGIEVSLLTLAPQPRFVTRATTDMQALIKGIDLIAPDPGLARFVEALNEAAERVERDKTNHFPVVVIVGSTSAEASQVLERDVQRMLQRFAGRAAAVHVIILSTSNPAGRSANTNNQMIVGEQVAKVTGGRYETIAAATRLATLLPEIGAQIAKSHVRQKSQFRITFQRPTSATGPVGTIEAHTRPSLTLSLSINGRIQ
jgi:hypothetical protein